MRRWFIVATAATFFVAVIGGVSFAGGKSGGDGIKKKEVLRFVDVTVEESFLDVEPEATGEEDVSPGDTFFFHDELWNKNRTTQLGSLQGSCTFLFEFTAHCQATVFLAKGTIQLEGGVEFTEEEGPGSFFVAVTGGTERYKNVVGQAEVIEGADEEESVGKLVIELIPSFKRP